MSKQPKQKHCGNTDCENKFKQYNSLIKYCCANCKTAMEGYKKIARLSAKRQAQNEAYLLLRKVYLQRHPNCEAALKGCTYKATEIHHSKKRTGDKLCDIKYFVAICRNCHVICENNNIKFDK